MQCAVSVISVRRTLKANHHWQQQLKYRCWVCWQHYRRDNQNLRDNFVQVARRADVSLGRIALTVWKVQLQQRRTARILFEREAEQLQLHLLAQVWSAWKQRTQQTARLRLSACSVSNRTEKQGKVRVFAAWKEMAVKKLGKSRFFWLNCPFGGSVCFTFSYLSQQKKSLFLLRFTGNEGSLAFSSTIYP